MVRRLLSRPLAGVALLVLLAGGPTGPVALAHLSGPPGAGCGTQPGASCPDVLVEGLAGPSAVAAHCAICHGLQSFRAHLVARSALLAAPAPAGPLVAIALESAPQRALPATPGRSPPLAA
jgi:hypothetical protein